MEQVMHIVSSNIHVKAFSTMLSSALLSEALNANNT